MKSIGVQTTGRNWMKRKTNPLQAVAVLVIWLAAGLVPLKPVTTSQAMDGERMTAVCDHSQYWEYFLAHPPDSPRMTVNNCLTASSEAVQHDSSASLYWEYIMENNLDTARFAQVPVLPVTGGVVKPIDFASSYWEYFIENNPDSPQFAQVLGLPESEVRTIR